MIPQNGMYPSLPSKSKIWIKKGPIFSLNDISRGEIIVYKEFKNEKKYYFIWRVIGIPGDHVVIKDTNIDVNHNRLNRNIINENSEEILYLEKIEENEYQVAYRKEPKANARIDIDIVVPPNHYYLMGDNRDNAHDSRYVGSISADKIIGVKIN